jgi:hypothetical protein
MNISIKIPMNNYSNYQHLLCHKEAILMDSTNWNVTKCTPVEVQWYFGGLARQARHQHEACGKHSTGGLVLDYMALYPRRLYSW